MKGSDYQRIEKAIHYLVKNAKSRPSLEDLAGFLNLSDFHCHRLFKKWAGITPKDFLQVITLAEAKSLLIDSRSVLDTSLDLGLTSPSRLHDLFIRYEAMTPGVYKSGGPDLEISWGQFESPIGLVALGLTDKGICSLDFVETQAQALRDIRKRWPKAKLTLNDRAIRPWAREIISRMKGEKKSELGLVMKGTPFQVKVWEALLKVPEGKVTTYREIANLIGSPTSLRAVGTAVGANPIGYLIPCHRVIKSTGIIGDYRWGPTRKKALLASEISRSL